MQVESFTMTPSELQAFANQVKDYLLTTLERAGALENGTALCGQYAVVVVKQTWLGKLWDKMRGTTGEGYNLQIVQCATTKNTDRWDQEIKLW